MSSDTSMTCEEALRLLAVFLDGELHGPPHADVEHHLQVCRGCYSRAEFERRLKAQVRRLGREDVSPCFAARVRGILDSFTSAAPERADRP